MNPNFNVWVLQNLLTTQLKLKQHHRNVVKSYQWNRAIYEANRPTDSQRSRMYSLLKTYSVPL